MNFKKIITLICCFVAGLFAVGCDLSSILGDISQSSQKIEAPAYLKILTLENEVLTYYTSYENLMLLTNENPNATSYRFVAYSDENAKAEFESDKNFYKLIDIFESDKIIFDATKTYYFYAHALKDSVLSSPSQTVSIVFKEILYTPQLAIDSENRILSWTDDNIYSCTYSVYEYMEDGTYILIQDNINELEYNINNYIEENHDRNINFVVKATSNNIGYKNSEYSNVVLYNCNATLFNPRNLVITDDFDSVSGDLVYTLTWEQKLKADTYEIYVDGVYYGQTTDTTYSLSGLDVGTYNVHVVSKSDNKDIIPSSEVYSVVFNRERYLQAVSNILISQDGENLNVEFSTVAHALTYRITKNGNLLYENLSTNKFTINVKDDFISEDYYQFSISPNSNGYYISGATTTSSKFNFTRYLKTPVITSITEENESIWLQLGVTIFDKKIKVIIDDDDVLSSQYSIGNSTNIKVDLKSYLCEDKIYTIKVQSLGYAGAADSDISLPVQYVNKVALSTPVINKIKTSDDGQFIVVNWSEIEYAVGYRVYVNDNLYSEVTSTTCSISKISVTELEEGGYNIRVQAIGGNFGYIDSNGATNTYYKGYDTIPYPTGVKVNKTQNGFSVQWDKVSLADSYLVYIDNKEYSTTNAVFDYEVGENSPKIYQIVVKTKSNTDGVSEGTSPIMINLSSVTKVGYTDKFVYFGGGWQDFYIENLDEFYTICKYEYFAYETEFSIYLANNVFDMNDISNSFSREIRKAGEDFGTYSIDFAASIIDYKMTITYTYTNNTTYPPTTSTTSAYKNLSQQKLYYNEVENMTRRSQDYNDFITENSLIEVEVSNTNQLYMCAEDGAKPIFTVDNYEAEESYNKCKEILREIISDDMTDFQKALAIYDYINYNSVYDSGYADQNMDNARYWLNGPLLDGVGVCDGFSKLYSLLCNMEGIKTVKISGQATNDGENYSGHAWNKIYLDADGDGLKEWYNLDLTWDGQEIMFENSGAYVAYEYSKHQYFLVTDKVLNEKHTAFVDKYQGQATTEFNYYAKMVFDTINNYDYYITSVDELAGYIDYLANNSSLVNGRDVYINVPDMDTATALSEAYKITKHNIYSNYTQNLTGNIWSICLASIK